MLEAGEQSRGGKDGGHMDYVQRWIKSVSKHWKRELFGGVLIASLPLFSEVTGITIPPYVYLVCVVALLFYAMFLAWRDAYEISETANQREHAREALSLKETRAMLFESEITAV